MTKMNLGILGILQMKWPDNAKFLSEEYRIIHSRYRQEKVRIIIKKDLRRSVMGYVQYNRRIIPVEIKSEPKNTVILYVKIN